MEKFILGQPTAPHESKATEHVEGIALDKFSGNELQKGDKVIVKTDNSKYIFKKRQEAIILTKEENNKEVLLDTFFGNRVDEVGAVKGDRMQINLLDGRTLDTSRVIGITKESKLSQDKIDKTFPNTEVRVDTADFQDARFATNSELEAASA